VRPATSGVSASREPEKKPDVVLKMPHDVAVTVMSVFGCVNGSLNNNYREDTDAVYDALYGLGISSKATDRVETCHITLRDR
jgi:hypothetical protein